MRILAESSSRGRRRAVARRPAVTARAVRMRRERAVDHLRDPLFEVCGHRVGLCLGEVAVLHGLVELRLLVRDKRRDQTGFRLAGRGVGDLAERLPRLAARSSDRSR